MSVVILSKDYASSTWCLDELVMILEQRRSYGQVVLPVFYDVEPSQVRKQTGTIGEAFVGYQNQFEEETDSEMKVKLMEKIKGWRSALAEVANMIGLRNQDDGYEAKFIENIIKEIKDKLRPTTLDVSPYEIGIESRAKIINEWLQDDSNDDPVYAICGMGGIGKTTIAKFVFNQNSGSFDGSSFLANIREVSEQPNGLVSLQRQLLSDISRRKHRKISNVDEGLTKIRNLVSSKRVLLVLDDVDQANQMYSICGMQDWLSSGSKVIITTRDERLVKSQHIYRVEKLGPKESIKLFSLHAFGGDYTPECYTEHTNRAVQICEGLPLALKVVGSSLSGKTQEKWATELAILEAIPHDQILKILKISYDSLKDSEKRLFLDISCFFVGTDEDWVVKVLEKCDLYAKARIQSLIDRCLLEIEGHKVLRMHRLIQDMGREIVNQESLEGGERSRLWCHEDAFRVLINEMGTGKVEGFTLDMDMLKEDGNKEKKSRYEEFRDTKSTLSSYGSSLKRRCLSFISGQYSKSATLTSRNDVYMRTDAFKSMRKLRLLKLNYVKLTGSYGNFSKILLWLCWHGFPLKSIPAEFALENLVVLDLRHSSLQQVWKETPFLASLKILDLSYCKWLESTPNFLGLPNLEKLILKGCMRLVEVCEFIGNLEMLDLIDLQDCKSLRKLPSSIVKLRSLRTLVISGCNLCELPSDMKILKSLEVLNANGIVISPLNSICGEVKWWHWVARLMFSKLIKGPENLWASFPSCLKELRLSGCNLFDDSFPENFGNLPSLSYLDLSKSQFSRLPNCIGSLRGLKDLDVHECHRLQLIELNGLPMEAGWIDAKNCRSLENVTSLNGSVQICLGGCHKLVELEDCFKQEETSTSGSKQYIRGIFEYGIFSMYLNDEDIPTFLGEKLEGSSILFTVPYFPTRRIQCWKVWCISKMIKNKELIIKRLSVEIKNKTKNLTWIYHPNYILHGECVGWLSRWRFGNQLVGGDEISVTFDGMGEYDVRECGFKIVYYSDDDEQEENKYEDSHHDRLKHSL